MVKIPKLEPLSREDEFLIGLGNLNDVSPFEFILSAESFGIEIGEKLFHQMIVREGGFKLFVKCVTHTSAFDETFRDREFMETFIETVLLWEKTGGLKELLSRRPGIVLKYYLKHLKDRLRVVGFASRPYMSFEEIVYLWAWHNKEREGFPKEIWVEISNVHADVHTVSTMVS